MGERHRIWSVSIRLNIISCAFMGLTHSGFLRYFDAFVLFKADFAAIIHSTWLKRVD